MAVPLILLHNIYMMKEMLPLEAELYNAWVAYYDMPSGLTDEEAGPINARCYEAYEKAYDELGGQWVQSIIKAARTAVGDDI